MEYFTRERYLALQASDPAAADAADADWNAAVTRYDAYLASIRPGLAEGVQELLDGHFLHDARLLSMGQHDDTFVITLQLDVPPREVLTLTYTLAGSPTIQKKPFPWGEQQALWLCDELERTADDPPAFVHSVLLSNGWELTLPFTQIAVVALTPVYPVPVTA